MRPTLQFSAFWTVSHTIMTEIDTPATSNSVETSVGPVTDAAVDRPAIRDYETMLRDVGLRPTQQRVALARLLFSQRDGHFTAETVYNEAEQSSLQVSLATVYNTLNIQAWAVARNRRRRDHHLFRHQDQRSSSLLHRMRSRNSRHPEYSNPYRQDVIHPRGL
jgi:hypothetical protein